MERAIELGRRSNIHRARWIDGVCCNPRLNRTGGFFPRFERWQGQEGVFAALFRKVIP